MRQRVMIAMALVNDPDLLIADEPTTALDVTTQAQILELMDRLQREFGSAIIMITHDLGRDRGDRRRRRRHVRRRASSSTARSTELFKRPHHPYTWGLLGSLPRLDADDRAAGRRSRAAAVAPEPAARLPLPPALPVRDEHLQQEEPPLRPVADDPEPPAGLPPRRGDQGPRGGQAARRHARRGQQLASWGWPKQRRRRRRSGDDLLVVENLKKHFPVTRGIVFQKQVAAVKAVDGVSFSVKKGETLGVVGESGCGKSTHGALHHAAARRRPTGGSRSTGRDITKLSRSAHAPDPARDDDDLPGPVRVAERAQARRLHRRRGARGARLGTAAEIKRRVQELLEVVGLNPEHYNRFPHEFSGGQRQRIGVARALAVEPEADRLRRARLGARRVGAGADPQPARATCSATSGSPTSSSRTTSTSSATSPTA